MIASLKFSSSKIWIDHFKLKIFGNYYKNMSFFHLLPTHTRQYHIALGFCAYMVLSQIYEYIVIFSVIFVINDHPNRVNARQNSLFQLAADALVLHVLIIVLADTTARLASKPRLGLTHPQLSMESSIFGHGFIFIYLFPLRGDKVSRLNLRLASIL